MGYKLTFEERTSGPIMLFSSTGNTEVSGVEVAIMEMIMELGGSWKYGKEASFVF
jgi:hypothetical protein